tara:strand:+ start:151 stop:750 length:600 start_codon:yes stop_codon:yes gene_type:complete
MDSIRSLFATPLLQTYLPVQDKILKFVESQEFVYHGNGHITSEDLLDNTQMHVVRDCITERVEEFVYGDCGISSEMEIELISSWANLHKKGDFAQIHSHYNSIISGVWYLTTTPKTGKFVVHSDHKLFGNLLDFPKRVYNEFNNDSYSFIPQNGDLIIFPSTLKHSVTHNEEDIDRFSIAFNYMLRGDMVNGKQTKVKL